MEEEKKTPVVVTEEVKIRPLRKKAQEKYPDFKPEKDEEWNDKEDEIFGEMEKVNADFVNSEKILDELLASDPELAAVLNDMIVDKVPFRVAIAKHYSKEDLIPVEGEDDYEAYQSAYAERVDKKKKKDERDAEIAANEKETMDNIDAFAAEKGMDDDAKKNFIGFINDLFDEMLFKKISKDMLTAFYNAMNHDQDVASAKEAGEIEGRNSKIEADMAAEEEAEKGDGMPQIDKGAGAEEQKQEQKTILDDIVGRNRKF